MGRTARSRRVGERMPSKYWKIKKRKNRKLAKTYIERMQYAVDQYSFAVLDNNQARIKKWGNIVEKTANKLSACSPTLKRKTP